MPLPRRTLDVLPAVLSPECQLGAHAATTSGMIPDPKQHQLSPPQPTGTRCNGVFLVCTFCQSQASETHRAVHYSASPNPNHHPNKEKPWLLCCLLGGRRLAEGGVTLLWVREAPGSLSAGPWAEDSSHPQVQRCPAELPRELR